MVAKVCTVTFGGVAVGVLAQQDGDTAASFQYTPDWAVGGFSIAPLHMPLDANKVYTFDRLNYETFKGLPAVFADSLPDDFGNALINAWIARRGLSPDQFTAIDRLLYTGRRGMGALEYEPVTKVGNTEAFEVNLSELVGLAQSVLDHREQFSAELSESSAMASLLQIGTSAGGARPKAVIAINAARDKVLSGQVDAPDGFEHYLLKFDGVSDKNTSSQTFGDPKGFGVMEYVYYKMATKCGIKMQHCELLPEGNRRHFMTKRFDREQNQKYHVLTLCGMAHADFKKPGQYSYEELLAVARTLNLNYMEQEQIFRRMVFNIVARNHDDHTKNTAFFVDDEFQWALAPAYDLAWSYKVGSPWVEKHQMSCNGKRDNFQRSDLLAVSALITNLGAKKANDIIDSTIEVVSQWPQLATEEGVDFEMTKVVASSHRLNI